MSDGGDGEQETRHSPAGFEAPDPELHDETVVCAGCGETENVGEMGMVADESVERDGHVVEIRRHYLHNDEECMMGYLGVTTDEEDA